MIIKLTKDQEINGKLRLAGLVMEIQDSEAAANLECEIITQDGHSGTSREHSDKFLKAQNESKNLKVLAKPKRESLQSGDDSKHIG